MILQEFTERTGLTVSTEEYELIDAMYLAAGNMDKDEFCIDYKKHNRSTILSTMYREVELLKEKCKNFRNQQNETAELLIGKAHVYNDSDFRKHAVRLIGEKRVVLMTLALDLPLWSEDKEYIIANFQ